MEEKDLDPILDEVARHLCEIKEHLATHNETLEEIKKAVIPAPPPHLNTLPIDDLAKSHTGRQVQPVNASVQALHPPTDPPQTLNDVVQFVRDITEQIHILGIQLSAIKEAVPRQTRLTSQGEPEGGGSKPD